MTWRLAKSLETLRAQVNATYLGRSKTSDGAVGDTAHAATKSDHNPDAKGVVRAIDITHDPAHGLNITDLAEALLASRDPRIKYVICNGRIFSSKQSPWVWRPYTGVNAHSKHIHVSTVENDALADDTRPWALPGKPSIPAVAKPFPNYRSLVGGFFSSTPFDLKIPTSIRTNNPGALNASPWVKAYPGYVGDKVTSMSGASANNTAIFETPEQGVAAWFELMRRYAQSGAVTVKQIIEKYGGGQNYSAYVDFVTKKTGLPAGYGIVLNGDDSSLMNFAKAMWHYEAGRATPLSDAQIMYGFNLARKTGGNVAGVVAAAFILAGGGVGANEAQKVGHHPALIGFGFVLVVAIAVTAFLLVRKLARK